MNKKSKSIDGFVLRKSGGQLGGQLVPSEKTAKPTKVHKPDKKHNKTESIIANGLVRPESFVDNSQVDEIQEGRDLSRFDIDDSLKQLDVIDQEPVKKLTRRERRKAKKEAKLARKKQRSKWRKAIKWGIILLVLAGLGYGGYVGYKLLTTSDRVFNGNIFQVFQHVPLKQDANGRSNFLILGTSEDDPGHEGAMLTDTMIVVSIDQTNHNAYTFSIPRDLYVEYGEACFSGYAGKINAYFFCANDGDTAEDEQDRLTKTQTLIGDIFGLDIQYGVHINYTVVKDAVDAVGGVDVDIQGSGGEPGVMDRHFDYICNYECYLVKYDNGVHHLDGTQALNLARARGDEAPTYGLSRSNFDREINQQKILIALKEKAASSGTLTDLTKIMKLIDALGNNLRTNIQTKEIRTLVDIASKTKSEDIHMISLVGDGGTESMMTTADNNVVPIAGYFQYDRIRSFISDIINATPVQQENAPTVVLNGTGQDGYGQTKADELTAQGFNISSINTAPEGTYEPVEVYQIGEGNPATAEKLTSMYNVTIKKTTPPVLVNGDDRFVVIFGSVTP